MTQYCLLFVVNGHEFTAAQWLPVLSGARQAGYEVEAVAPGESPAFNRLRSEGFAVHSVRLNRRGTRVWEELGSIRELSHLYRRVRPDLVHHATIKPVIYGSLAAQRASVPAVVNAITGLGYVYTGEDLKSAILRRIVDALYRRAFRHSNQRVIFQNSDDQWLLEKSVALAPSASLIIPGCGVDVVRFTLTPEAYGIPVVVLPGRMLWDKGVAEFVEAARRLRGQGYAVRFVLVGGLDEGNPSGIAKLQLREWVREGVVEWWGQVSDMWKVYRSAHIVALPSYREGLPTVLIEAQACGRAVVTTDAPGCRDAIIDGVTGYLVPPKDARGLADRIAALLANPNHRMALGRAGRDLAEARFSTERVVNDTLAVYEELLGTSA